MQPPLDSPRQLLIVDDHVTSGGTLYAAASLFGDPDWVRVFAALRSMGGVEVENLLAPSVGTVRYLEDEDRTERRPYLTWPPFTELRQPTETSASFPPGPS